jgi:hypothetical protein
VTLHVEVSPDRILFIIARLATIVSKAWPRGTAARKKIERPIYLCRDGYSFIDDEDRRPRDQLEIVWMRGSRQSTAFKELDLLYQQILSICPNTSLLLRILRY